ncbi:MAG TPA: hypothetical protein VK609_01390 [Mucilaginibacter sp.]|nr:hypothetical protein [Mucilaginibacter sp.]
MSIIKGSFAIMALLAVGSLFASVKVKPYSWQHLPHVGSPV